MLKIGTIELQHDTVLAPLAGYTDSPFRRLAMEMGAGLVSTELISAEALIRHNQKTMALMSHTEQERPLAVQLLGNDSATLVRAAQIAIDGGADLIDLNLGCPARNVVASGSGAALLKKPELVREILRDMRQAIPIPFTVKTRIGWDESSKNILQIVDIANEQGVDAIAIHLRTRQQGFKRGIDLQSLVDAVKISKIPVIGNGDILCPADARAMIEASGCAGVMIGRGALGNPWIFQMIDSLQKGTYVVPSLYDVRNVMIKHVRMMHEFYGEAKGTKLFRKHLVHYSRGGPVSPLTGARYSADFRAKAVTTEGLEPLITLINAYFDYLEEHHV